MRLNIPSFILVFVLTFSGFSCPGFAQQCGITKSTVASFGSPDEISPSLWSMNDGDKNLYDRFIGGFVDPADNDLIVLGERYYNAGDNVGLTLRKLDGRGRTKWDTILNNQNFEKIIKIVQLGDGLMVLAKREGHKQSARAWAGFFDLEGNLLQSTDIAAPKGALTPFDILPLNGARSFLMTGQVKDGAEAPYTVLYRLDRKARVTSRKAYQMGLENALLSLTLGKGGFVYGAGYILGQDGRKSAWISKLNEDGGIVWQRQYARGKSAEFERIGLFDKDNLVLGGVSAPYNLKTSTSRNKGAWVAMLEESNGNMLWERFYSEPNQDLFVRDLFVHPDGQFSVLMDAAVNADSPGDVMPFARLASLNARGAMLESAVYLNGKGSDAYALVIGRKTERIILGSTKSPYTALVRDPEKPDAPLQQKNAIAPQGWALAVPGASPYEDPCKRN